MNAFINQEGFLIIEPKNKEEELAINRWYNKNQNYKLRDIIYYKTPQQ